MDRRAVAGMGLRGGRPQVAAGSTRPWGSCRRRREPGRRHLRFPAAKDPRSGRALGPGGGIASLNGGRCRTCRQRRRCPVITRWGSRRVMLVASTVVSVSPAVIGLATSPVMLAAGLVGMLGFDVLVDAAVNMQRSWLSRRRRSPVMNRLHGLWRLGTLIGGLASSGGCPVRGPERLMESATPTRGRWRSAAPSSLSASR